MPLRVRVALLAIVLPLLAVLSMGYVALRSTRSAILNEVDDRLFAARAEQRGPLRNNTTPQRAPRSSTTSPDVTGRSIAVLRINGEGTVVVAAAGFDDAPLPLPRIPKNLSTLDRQPITTAAESGSTTYRLLASRSAPGGSVTVWALSLRSMQTSLADVRRILAITSAIVLAIGTVIGWALFRRDMKRLREILAATQSFAAGDLAARIVIRPARSEIDQMAHHLNAMFDTATTAISDAATANLNLTEFMDDVGHEIRTPITTIGGYVELYRQGAITNEAALDQLVDRVGAENHRIETLIGELSLLARTGTLRQEDRLPVDLGAVLANAAADAMAIEPDRRIEIHCPDNLLVAGDRVRIEQMTSNLFDNVRSHTPPTTTLTITVTTFDTGLVTAAFADDGPGIDPHVMEGLFDRSVRSESSTGRGLGLFIVKRIAEAHGGTVRAGRNLNGGTVITLTVPTCSDDRSPVP